MERPIEVLVGELLRRRGLRIAVAESCTGGLIGHLLTNVPGSSTYFVGGCQVYAYEAKVRLLDVSWDTLERYGAVSKEVAIEMAHNVRQVLATDIGLSATGIAGPGGGMPQKPVGYVCIGLSTPDGDQAWSYNWDGDRLANKQRTAEQALRLVVEYLQGKELPDPSSDSSETA
jgi:PncC family amidohydrolase